MQAVEERGCPCKGGLVLSEKCERESGDTSCPRVYSATIFLRGMYPSGTHRKSISGATTLAENANAPTMITATRASKLVELCRPGSAMPPASRSRLGTPGANANCCSVRYPSLAMARKWTVSHCVNGSASRSSSDAPVEPRDAASSCLRCPTSGGCPRRSAIRPDSSKGATSTLDRIARRTVQIRVVSDQRRMRFSSEESIDWMEGRQAALVRGARAT